MSDRRPLRSSSTAVPIFRIVSLLVMLAVIGLTIYNLHQRATVAGFAPEGAAQAPRGTEEIAGKTPSIRGTPPGNLLRPLPPRHPRRSESRSPMKTPSSGSSFAAAPKRSWTNRRSSTATRSRVLATDALGPVAIAGRFSRRDRCREVPFQNFLQHPGKYRGRPVRVALEIRQAC